MSLLKTQNINTKMYVSLEQLRMINMQRTSAIEMFAVLSKCVSITITVRVSLNLFHLNNLFLWRNDGKFWYKWIHHCTWKIAYNRPGTVRCPANLLQRRTVPGRASADVIIYDAGRRPCDMWPRKRRFLKIVRCPGDYQIRRWCANRWNRTMSVLFVTIALVVFKRTPLMSCCVTQLKNVFSTSRFFLVDEVWRA